MGMALLMAATIAQPRGALHYLRGYGAGAARSGAGQPLGCRAEDGRAAKRADRRGHKEPKLPSALATTPALAPLAPTPPPVKGWQAHRVAQYKTRLFRGGALRQAALSLPLIPLGCRGGT